MFKHKIIALILPCLIASACERPPAGNPPSAPPQSTQTSPTEPALIPDLIDNKYVKIIKENNNFIYNIKQTTIKPVVINSDGNIIENKNISDISYQEFLKSAFLLMPQGDLFVQQFLANPFENEPLLSKARPSLWGYELIHGKTDKNTVVFRIGEKLAQAQPELITKKQHEQLNQRLNLQPLGKGGIGEVFSFSYDGKNYALKSRATEIDAMEKLQFTDAVARIYAYFSVDDTKFMIMEQGKEDLAQLDKDKRKLSEAQVLDAVARFKKLIDAQAVLEIKNLDIKPQNLLLTHDDRLVVIDISEAFTQAYIGTEGQLLARALFENQYDKDLKGGYISLDRFYEFDDPAYRDNNIISPLLFIHWNQATCKKYLSAENACDGVTNFNELFELLNQAQLAKIGEEINAYYTSQSKKPDTTGTHDSKYGLYKTDLPMPNIYNISPQAWDNYFIKREEIGKVFCRYLRNSSFKSTNWYHFFQNLRPKYENFCVKQAEDFLSPDEVKFHNWIEDALSPGIKFETFKYLARNNTDLDQARRSILEEEAHKPNNLIGKALLELFNYEPAEH